MNVSTPIIDSSRLLEEHIENLPFSYNDGLVLFLDIMGFKDRILRTPHEQLDSQLREFKKRHSKLKPLMDNGSIELLHFSDSIIVVAHKAAQAEIPVHMLNWGKWNVKISGV